MEYLKNIQQKLKIFDEEKIRWYSVFEMPWMVYGAPLFNVTRNFNKYPYEMVEEIEEFPIENKKADLRVGFKSYRSYTSGCMIRFHINAKYFLLKTEISRVFDFHKLTLYNSSGFDIYFYDTINKTYIHNTVCAPKTGEKIFVEKISVPNNEYDVVIFLPTYNDVVNLFIGVEQDKMISKSKEFRKMLPICFYGHSITQGASASRSGNICCNIVGRNAGAEIYNYSMSNCCVGFQSIAKLIGNLNISAIVLDYSRNASSVEYFKNTFKNFYSTLRKYHKNIPIIIITASNFLKNKLYVEFDKIIIRTYKEAEQKGENVFLIDIMKLFDDIEYYDLLAVDGGHYEDMCMLKLANAITNILVN